MELPMNIEIARNQYVEENEQIKKLRWTNALSVGIEKIDSQHIQFLNITNQLVEAEGFEIGHVAMSEILFACLKYIRQNFFEEIQLLSKMNYPKLDSLKEEQREFKLQIANYCQRAVERDENVQKDLTLFLIEWNKIQLDKITAIKQTIYYLQ